MLPTLQRMLLIMFHPRLNLILSNTNLAEGHFMWNKADWSSMNKFLYKIDWNNIIVNDAGSDTNSSTFIDVLYTGISAFVPFAENNSTATIRKRNPKKSL